MRKNRIVFIGSWLVFVALMFIFPGFEVRGLVLGLIPGYWPFIFAPHASPWIVLPVMLLLSGMLVVVCSLLMDKAKVFRWYLLLLILAILLGGTYFALNGMTYVQWERSPIVQQAAESPELNYQPTMWDYDKQIFIPRTLAGCLWGLYLTSILGGLASIVIILYKKKKPPLLPDQDL